MITSNTREQKLDLQRQFANLYPLIRGEGIQFHTRCVLCGDSKKDPNKMRLGIKINPDNPEEPILYHCFNCEERGVVTNRLLKDIMDNIGCHKLKDVNVDAINKSILNSGGNTRINRYKNTRVLSATIPPLMSDDNQIRKAKYVFDRIGKIIDPVELPSIKIIWSIRQFLEMNNIKSEDKYIWLLEKDYVGFLTINNDFIIFRDITNSHKMRYVKYNIHGLYDNSNCFYSIPNKIDLLTLDDIHIKVAEGPFDIISILYNLDNNNRKNTVYCASGNSYLYNPLLNYFNKGIVGSNVHVDIYRDNDLDYDFGNLKKKIKIYTGSTQNTSIYYNAASNEKDFGVPLNRIQLERLY